MTYPRALAAAALSLLCGSAALAGPDFDCTITPHTRSGFVPTRVLVFFDNDFATAHLHDSIIADIQDEPAPVQVKKIGKTKYSLTWMLENMPVNPGGTVQIRNLFRIDVARMRSSFTAYVSGYDNDDRGTGTCKPYVRKK